ncbi:MAG: hypothetical protein M3O09_02550 [Acidobacteriota bacterium]|nr:hypothetical protein [Acidobacteriota bacterium]
MTFCAAAFAGTVSVASPVDGSNVNSPVHVHATYNGTVTASYMKVWVDHVAGTVQLNTSVFDTQITLANGPHLIEVQAKDASSGVIYTTPTNITVATLALNPSSASLTSGSVQQFTASDSSGASITWSATGGSISSGGLYTAGSTAGKFAVTATDSNGNKAVSPVTIASPHTVTIQSPINGSSVTSPVLVKATYNGTVVANYMKVWVDHVAGTVQLNTNSFSTSIYLSNGSHLIEVQASDPSTGQVYTTPTTITVVGAVAVSPAAVTLQAGKTQQFTATDKAGLPVTWTATGGSISGSGLYTAGTAAGTFTVTATDSQNNSGKATVTIQNTTTHVVTISSPLNGSTVTSPVHVHATYNGSVTATYMKVWVDHVAGTVQMNTNVFDTSLTLANGGHLIEVQASDPSTGQVYTTPSSITVSNGTVTISPASVTLLTGASQQFTATDSAGLPVTWSATGGTISNAGLYQAGTTAGTFTVTAKDSSNTTGKATVTIQSSTTHSVTIQNPLNGSTVNSPVNVHATYNGSVTATYMKVWVDHVAGTVQMNTNVFDTDLTLGGGGHLIEVQASDPSTGQIYTTAVNITVNNSSGGVVTVSPTSAILQPGKTQQFTATDGAGLAVTWSATGGTITGSGLYTAGSANGSFAVTATDSQNNLGKASVTIQSGGGSALNYTTWKNDNLGTGQQTKETFLAPANVNTANFGILFSNTVDGAVFAQPLYMSNLSIGGATHNVVFVATENDSVYAFDADKAGAPLWKVSLIPAGATTVPTTLVGSTIFPKIGITGTPVIDPATGTLYVAGETLESSKVVFRLHALDIITGNERGGSPTVITAPGWQPLEQMQRPGLLLANGNVYIGFGSHGDHDPYHGWLFAYSAASLAQVGVWNVTPTGIEGAIWTSGAAPSADSSGNIYVITSNGTFDGTTNYSSSFVKLSPNLTILDYFTPFNQAKLSANDQDLGSGGALLVPDQPGAFPHEVIGCGKASAIFVLNRDNMGKFQTGSNSQIIQEIDNQVGGTVGKQAPDACFMTPAFWQQTLYFLGNNDVLKAFSLNPTTGKLSTTPTSQGTYLFSFPGGQPVVSSNGSSNGIVWVMEYLPTVALHAYDAKNLSIELYRSGSLGAGAKFVAPTVVNSKVYVGTATKLVVFGPI